MIPQFISNMLVMVTLIKYLENQVNDSINKGYKWRSNQQNMLQDCIHTLQYYHMYKMNLHYIQMYILMEIPLTKL